MDEDLYDEFGNYIGPELADSDVEISEGEEEEEELERQQQHHNNNNNLALVEHDERRIVLHEDKRYYPDASEVYPGVRAITVDEDAQDLSEPIIKPIKTKNFAVTDKSIPLQTYSSSFVASLMANPRLTRHVAILGHFHHGKTLFVDSLVGATLEPGQWNEDPTKEMRYTDTRVDEQARQLSVKSCVASLVLQNLKLKSYLVNVVDCPGHVCFSDEVTASVRASDGAVLVVDAVEGVMLSTERHLKQALLAEIPVCLVINKMDRLILELKLPPQDAYYKLVHTIEDVNKIILANHPKTSLVDVNSLLLSPAKGNVCFASAQHGWSFTLDSFAQLYIQRHPSFGIDNKEFAKRLWGDWYHDGQRGLFSKTRPHGEALRTFVQYVLEPLYKLYAQVIGESPEELAVVLRRLNIHLKRKEIHMDPKPLLKIVMTKFFGYPHGFVDMVVNHIPSPLEGNTKKVEKYYSGFQTSDVAKSMHACDPNGPLMIHIVKLFNTSDGSRFFAFGRIYSGSVSAGQTVRVLGESFSMHDDEDAALVEVSGVSVGVGRFSIEMTSAGAGNWVLLEGIDGPIKKTATITDIVSSNSNNNRNDDVAIFSPLQFDTSSVMKLAVEPFLPAELPKMIDALRKINKSYPLAVTKVEESGEHVIVGTGELYLDCIMHDLRHLYSDIEIKVADPVVSFCETVVESSALKCFAETPNKKNKLTMLAEPLDSGLALDIELGNVNINWDKKKIGEFFKTKYDWDLLSARSVWAFGPNVQGPNLLMDDTIPSEVDSKLMASVRDSVVQGFRWACREGPLCDEPIRNVKFKLLDATIASEPIYRGGGQVIPSSRRSVYSSFLMASPRLMEPMYLVEIQCPADCIQAIYPVLARRRGHVVQDSPKPGAPFYTVKAFLPVMDSFGFETDLRSYTQGQAFCQQVFDHWVVAPGDPLDRDVILHPLEPSPPLALARDFMIKTRRRKGLSEDVTVSKYFDESMLLEIAKFEANASRMQI